MNETQTAQSSNDADTQSVLAELDASEAAEAAPKASKPTKAASENRGAEDVSAEQFESNDSAEKQEADDKSDTPASKVDEETETEKAQELSKEEKSSAREANTWKKINAEKEQLAREREELRRERDEINRSKPKEHGPEDYKKAAESWDARAQELEDAGKFSEAAEDRALAKQARQEAARLEKEIANRPKTPSTLRPSQENVEITKAIAQSWEKAKTEHPDILSQGSPHNVEFKAFIQSNPEVLEHPKGPELAAQHVSFKLQAARVPDLQKQVESLTAKIRSLEALASPASGGVARNTEPKPFNDLSTKEQERLLEAELG